MKWTENDITNSIEHLKQHKNVMAAAKLYHQQLSETGLKQYRDIKKARSSYCLNSRTRTRIS